MQFEFATSQRIIFGSRKSAQAGGLAKQFGRHALVLAGKHPERINPVLDSLRAEGLECTTHSVGHEPDLETIKEGVEQSRPFGAELIVAVGGGSVLDAGKAIAALLANPGEIFDYLEVIGKGRPLEQPSLPVIAIPTTAGTGSEVTRNAVIASPEHRVKVSLRSPFMLPRIALVDPELTREMPVALTASTGLDALTQLIEPYLSSRANPMTDALCVEGITRVARAFRRVISDGNDLKAREDMALAALFGGIALANAGLGAVHGFAGPIGGMFDAPHGAVCGILLPHVLQTNLRAVSSREPQSPVLERFQKIAALLTQSPEATPEEGIDWVRRFVAEVRVPSLSAYGVSESAIPELVSKASASSSMKSNPLRLTDEELAGVLRAAL